MKLRRISFDKSFLWLTQSSKLDYENAGIYASQLLETYSDYKSIWKTLQVITEDFQDGLHNFELVEARPTKDIRDHLKAFQDSAAKGAASNAKTYQDQVRSALVDSATAEMSKHEEKAEEILAKVKKSLDEYQIMSDRPLPFEPSIPKYKPYAATILGLLDARHDCRLEMVKIVNEVSFAD